MHYASGNIMKLIGRASAIVITTNGFVKSNGECVMGRGIAKQFADRYPTIPKLVGDSIKTKGNVVSVITNIAGTDIIIFPVKPVNIKYDGNNIVEHAKPKFSIGDIVPGFYAKATTEIIRDSCGRLNGIIREKQYKYIVLPLPGCGAGELSFKNDVEPILLEKFNHLDEVYIMSFKEKDFL